MKIEQTEHLNKEDYEDLIEELEKKGIKESLILNYYSQYCKENLLTESYYNRSLFVASLVVTEDLIHLGKGKGTCEICNDTLSGFSYYAGSYEVAKNKEVDTLTIKSLIDEQEITIQLDNAPINSDNFESWILNLKEFNNLTLKEHKLIKERVSIYINNIKNLITLKSNLKICLNCGQTSSDNETIKKTFNIKKTILGWK